MSKTKYQYKPQFAIVVKCGSEEEQKLIYEVLRKVGLTNLKVVSV